MLSASDNESMRSSSILPAKLVVRNSTGPQAKEHRDLQKLPKSCALLLSVWPVELEIS